MNAKMPAKKTTAAATLPRRKPSASDWWWSDIETAKKANPHFAALWPSLVSQFGDPPEVAWIYELQARTTDAYPWGRPFAELGFRELAAMQRLSRQWAAKELLIAALSHRWSAPKLRPSVVESSPGGPPMLPQPGEKWITVHLDLGSAGSKILSELRALISRVRAREKIPAPTWRPKEGEKRKPRSWEMIQALDYVAPPNQIITKATRNARDRAHEIWHESQRQGRFFDPN